MGCVTGVVVCGGLTVWPARWVASRSKVREDTTTLHTRLVLGRCRLVDTKLVPLVLEYIGDTYVHAVVGRGAVDGLGCGAAGLQRRGSRSRFLPLPAMCQ